MTAGTTRPTTRLTAIAGLLPWMLDVDVGARTVLVKDASVGLELGLSDFLGGPEAVIRACEDGRLVIISTAGKQVVKPRWEARKLPAESLRMSPGALVLLTVANMYGVIGTGDPNVVKHDPLEE